MHIHCFIYVGVFIYPFAITLLGLIIKVGAIGFLLKCPKLYEKLFFERDSPEVRECMDMIWNMEKRREMKTKGQIQNSKSKISEDSKCN